MRKFRSLNYFASICLVLLLMLLTVSTLLTACSTSETSPSATTSVTSPSASTPTEVFELKLSHHMPPVAPVAQALEEWAKKIEENTNGRVKITIYPSGALASGSDAYPSTAAGVCDIAYVNNIYEPSKWSLNNIVNQPALQIPTDIRGVEIWSKLWEKYPVMLDEFKGVKVLAHMVSLPASLHTTTAVRVPDDIKGMKISAQAGNLRVLRNIGASPVAIPANDWYMSLEKGLMAGILAPIGVLTDRGVEVLVQYHIDLGLGQGGSCLIINLDRWNSFPPDIQAVFEELHSWTTDAMIEANNRVISEGWDKCAGHTIIKPTPEELELWLAYALPVAEEWIADNEDKGPTREMFEYAQELIAEIE